MDSKENKKLILFTDASSNTDNDGKSVLGYVLLLEGAAMS